MPKKTNPSRWQRGWYVFTGYTCDTYRPVPRFKRVSERVAGDEQPPWEELDIGTVMPSLEEYFTAHALGHACSDARKVRVEIRVSYLRWTPEEEAEFARLREQERETYAAYRRGTRGGFLP